MDVNHAEARDKTSVVKLKPLWPQDNIKALHTSYASHDSVLVLDMSWHGQRRARLGVRKVPDVLKEPAVLPMLVLLAVVWLIPHTSVPLKVHHRVISQIPQIPKVKVDFHPQKTFASRYSTNKTAIYIEPRASITHITPLLVHMMEVVPPEWRFVFLGTQESSRVLIATGTAKKYQDWGKLRVGTIDRWTAAWGPRWDDLGIDEMYSRLLTNMSFYEEELPGVEHLFVFHSDGILCANSFRDVNDWLEYDWVGAPWNNIARFGGNGGLSLRKVSKIKQVLQFQTRLDHTFSEDEWLSSRMGLLPDAHMCDPVLEREFAVENIWQERPMGYHLNPVGWSEEVWGDAGKRSMIYEYCPEIKMIADFRLERERCPPMAGFPDGGEPPVFIVPEPAVVIDENGAVVGGIEDGIARIDFAGNVDINP